MFPTLATRLLAGAAAVLITFGAGFGAAWKVKDGIEAREALATARAAAAETGRQAGIAMSEAKAGSDAVNRIAAAAERQQVKIRTQTQILTREVTKYVPVEVDHGVVIPWGFVRVLDAAASGAGDPAAISVGAGQSDTAASDVALSEIATLSAANDGACRANAEQLAALEQWAGEVEHWYDGLVKRMQPPTDYSGR